MLHICWNVRLCIKVSEVLITNLSVLKHDDPAYFETSGEEGVSLVWLAKMVCSISRYQQISGRDV